MVNDEAEIMRIGARFSKLYELQNLPANLFLLKSPAAGAEPPVQQVPSEANRATAETTALPQPQPQPHPQPTAPSSTMNPLAALVLAALPSDRQGGGE